MQDTSINAAKIRIARNIKKLRKEKNVTQQELADGIGKSKSIIQKYEAEKVEIPYSTVEDIARFLQVSLETITEHGRETIEHRASLEEYAGEEIETIGLELSRERKEALERFVVDGLRDNNPDLYREPTKGWPDSPTGYDLIHNYLQLVYYEEKSWLRTKVMELTQYLTPKAMNRLIANLQDMNTNAENVRPPAEWEKGDTPTQGNGTQTPGTIPTVFTKILPEGSNE